MSKMTFNLKNKGEWIKFWGLKLHILVGSIICDDNIKYMYKQLGTNLNNLVLVSKKGYTTSYALVKERTEVGNSLIKKFVKNNSTKEIAYLIKSKAQNISKLIKEMSEKNFTNQESKELIQKFDEYHNLHIIPRKMIDAASPELAEKIIEDLKEARLAGETIHQDFDNLLSKFFEKISVKTKYSIDELLSMTRDEFFEFLDNNKLPDKKELAKRYESSGFVININKTVCTTDPKTVELLEHLNVNTDLKQGEIKGNIAFKGKVTGRARIIFDPFNVKVFNRGDILITGMTRPDFVPLMEKAAAIVTDAGGLLCHAAIVARELGKPCIIGTQFATKKFKDGDIVEVDANQGIVKKLSSK